jgi:hypothetical protein
MDKKSKIIFVIFIFLIIVSVYLLYKRSFVTYDFEINQEEPLEDLDNLE